MSGGGSGRPGFHANGCCNQADVHHKFKLRSTAAAHIYSRHRNSPHIVMAAATAWPSRYEPKPALKYLLRKHLDYGLPKALTTIAAICDHMRTYGFFQEFSDADLVAMAKCEQGPLLGARPAAIAIVG